MSLARISQTLSCHSSLSSITSGRTSRLHPVSVQSYCRHVLDGRLTPARLCEGVHWRKSFMSVFLLLQQCPTCLVRLFLRVLEIRWPYSCCFVGCCFQEFFNITRSILVQLPSSFFSVCLVIIHVVHPYSSLDMAWKQLRFILSDRSNFYMTDNLLIAVYSHVFMSFFVDETLVPR